MQQLALKPILSLASKAQLAVALLALAACSGEPAAVPQDDPSAEFGLDDDSAVAADDDPSVGATEPLARVQIADDRSLAFYGGGGDVAVVEVYSWGDAPLLTAEDKEMDPISLYQKYAPETEVPEALIEALLVQDSVDPAAELEPDAESTGSGGGAPQPGEGGGDSQIATISQALVHGDGCDPPHSNVVFNDCRTSWWNGYFAYSTSYRLDHRVHARIGKILVRMHSDHDNSNHYFWLNAGQVSDLRWGPAEACRCVVGYCFDCRNVKATRRLDVLNASNNMFDTDVVFFN